MNANEILCLGINGQIYTIKRYAELICDENGLPLRYEMPSLPSVWLIARAFTERELEEHPIRKAFFKYLAAKEHNIVEKQRPQDVTLEEARNMAETWFREKGFEKKEVDFFIKEYWNF